MRLAATWVLFILSLVLWPMIGLPWRLDAWPIFAVPLAMVIAALWTVADALRTDHEHGAARAIGTRVCIILLALPPPLLLAFALGRQALDAQR